MPSLDDAAKDLMHDCLARISKGDSNAAFDLASFWMGHIADQDTEIKLAIAEGLARQSAALGSKEAELFLRESWPSMKEVLRKRLDRLHANG
jgi:hypothetical protein